MKDRIPLYPGRVKLNPVSGQANTFDLTRADQPTQEGTPLNKASLLKDATAALYGKTAEAVPDDLLSVLSKSVLAQARGKYTKHTTIGEIPVGNTITLNENGTPVEFYVAKHDYESELNGTGRTLLVRKDCYNTQVYGTSDTVTFVTSSICTWLNGPYKALLPSDVQSAMGTTKFKATNGFSKQVFTAEKPVFLLSLTEYGLTNTYANTEGSPLPTASAIRIAQQNNANRTHWTRSPHNDMEYSFFTILQTGALSRSLYWTSNYVRPAFTLPASFGYVWYADEAGNVYSEQEYETMLTDVLGNLIAIPAGQIKDGVKLATGSYTGTGTYGSSNPNSLTFDFEPKLVFMFEDKLPLYKNINSQTYHPVYGTTIGMTTTYSRSLFNIYSGDNYFYAKKSSDGKTLSWYHEANASAQINKSGVTYQYIAIG